MCVKSKTVESEIFTKIIFSKIKETYLFLRCDEIIRQFKFLWTQRSTVQFQKAYDNCSAQLDLSKPKSISQLEKTSLRAFWVTAIQRKVI